MTRRRSSSSLPLSPVARAARSVIETLEARTFLTVSLPYSVDWTPGETRIGVNDSSTNGGAVPTGFETTTLGGATLTTNRYDATKLDVDTATGVLKLTTSGNGTNGSPFDADNTLWNNLVNSFDGTQDFSITTRVVGPLSSTYTAANQQAGIFFGADQDNYVKLVVGANNGPKIQFYDERKVGSSYVHTATNANTLTSISLTGVTSVDLRLDGRIDNVAGTAKLQAYYKLNDAATWTKITLEYNFSGTQKTTFFNGTSKAGVMAYHKNTLAPITAQFDRFSIAAAPVITGQPAVSAVRPASGATGVFRDAFVAADVNLPNDGGGIDPASLNSNTVRLIRTSDGVAVDAVVNTSGAGDAIVVQPRQLLAPNTEYTFQVTSALVDLTGVPFLSFSSTFTTGATAENPGDPNIAFEHVELPTATGQTYSAVEMGPDGKLYAATLDGKIQRFVVNADGTLGAPELINTIIGNNGGPRLIAGIVFDPTSTASNLIMYVSHSDATFPGSADYSGKISRLMGANLTTYDDYVFNLPRSYGDHTTNQMNFKPGTNLLYITQGAMNAMGAPDNGWKNRPEHKLSAAILQLDLNKFNAANPVAINVKTDDGGTYNPFDPANALTLYATGVRNAYDLVWHSNGHLYSATNGSAANGNIPATPANLADVPRRIDQNAAKSPAYTQAAPGITKNTIPATDKLYDIQPGKYYGHPNPSRGEYIYNAGNNPNDTFTDDLALYPVGLNPDRNYGGVAYTIGANYSPNGTIEYKGTAFGGALNGALMIARYSGGDDVMILKVNAAGQVTDTITGVAGLTGFVDPLDLIQFHDPAAAPNDPRNGNLYVIEHGAQKITLVRPIVPGAKVTPDKEQLLFSDPLGGAASATQTVTITNTGSSALALPSDTLVTIGTHAGMFTIVEKPNLPLTLAPGDSFQVKVAFNPTGTEGIKTAQLEVRTNAINISNLKIDLKGLATTGTGGNNEPSLQRVLDIHGIPVNVGDNDPDSTYLYEGAATGPTAASQEVALPRLVKAGAGPVTIEALGAYAVANDVSVRLGYYAAGSPAEKTELATVRDGDSESVSINLHGATAFDPIGAFGLYGTFPGNPDTILFKNNDAGGSGTTLGGSARDVYSEDMLNTWENASANRHKVRFYPLKNADGSIVPNAYVFAFEEYFENFDFNDFVGIIRNVAAAPGGPEIGVVNPDGAPQPNTITLSKLQTLDPGVYTDPNTGATSNPPDNKIHDQVTLKIVNTGSSPLTVTGATVTGNFTLVSPPSWPQVIQPNGSINLTVKITANSGSVHAGVLSINSNDPDEPVKTFTVKGVWQNRSEDGNEPTLAEILSAANYGTQVLAPGQGSINTKGMPTVRGDEVISPYWRSADGGEVTVRQLAAYHTQGNRATIRWYNQAGSGLPGAAAPAPTNLFVNPKPTSVTDVRFQLTWNDNTSNETGFTVERSSDNGKTWPVINHVTVGAGVKTTTVSGLTAGVQYLFRVRANRSAGNGGNTGFSNVAGGANQLTHLGVYGQTLFPNRQETASGYQPVSYFQPDGAFGFRIDSEYTDDALNDQTVDQSNGAVGPAGHHVRMYPAKRPDGTVIPNVYLMAMDYNGINYDYNDNVYIVSNIAPSNGVASPVGAAAYGDPDAGVKIDWADAVDPSLTGYNVYRAEGSGTFTKLNVSPLTSSDFVDPTAVTGTTYQYRVTSVGTNGEGLPTTITAVRPTAPTLAPNAPANASAKAQSSAQVKVSWNDVHGENGYRVEYSSNGGASWQLAGTVSDGATSMAVDNLDAGTLYQFRVFALNGIGASGASNVASATTDFATTPPIPTGFQATSVTATEVVLNWNNVTGETGYRVERSDDGGTIWSIADTTGVNVTTFIDVSVAGPFSYKYRVRSVNLNAPSAPSSVVTADVPAGIASAPTFVTPSALGETSIGLTWQNVAGEDGYKVEYSLDGTTGWTEIGQTIANQVTFTHSDLTAATKYYYRVRAFSAAVGATTYSPVGTTSTVPLAPGQAVAIADSHQQVTVTWPDSVGETGYKVQRSTDNGVTFTQVGTTGADELQFVDSTVEGNTAYQYRIVAINEGGDSAPGVAGLVTTPQPPAQEVIIDNVDTQHVTLVGTWTFATVTGGKFGASYLHDGKTGKGSKSATITPQLVATGDYEVFVWYPVATNYATNVPIDVINGAGGTTTRTINQRTNGGQWVSLGVFGFNAYNPATPTAGGHVTIRTNGTTSGYVIFDAIRFLPAGALPPAAPTNVTPTLVTANSITLGWVDGSTSETGYKVARKGPGETSFTDLPGTLPANTTSYVDSTVTAGSTYTYQVRAIGVAGDSTATSSPAITTVPATPTGLTQVPAGARAITINWTDGLGETGYLVEFSTSPDGSTGWTTAGTTAVDVATFTHAGRTPETTLYYRVTASNTAGSSAVSSTLTASTSALPTTPTGLGAVAEVAGGVTLTWGDVPDDSGYRIQRTTDPVNGPWTTVLSPLTDATTAFDASTLPGTQYTYRIVAANAFGDESAPSTTATVTAQGVIIPPANPSGVTAVVSSPTTLTIAWTDNATNEDSYLLQRSEDNGATWTDIVLPANTNEYVDTRSPAIAYLYRVTARNSGGDSQPVTVTSDVVIDNTDPAYLQFSGTWNTASSLANRWGVDYLHDNNTGRGTKAVSFIPRLTTAAQYEVYIWYAASSNRSSKTKIDIFDDDSSTTPQAALTINQRVNGGQWVSLGVYDFAAYDALNPLAGGRVRVGNAGADGYVMADAFRFRKLVPVAQGPNSPSELIVAGVTTNSVTLEWTDNSDDETGFIISRKAGSSNVFVDLPALAANATTFTDTNVLPGTSYQYQVRAKGLDADSGTTLPAGTVTIPAAPVLNTVNSAGAHRLNLSWPNVTGNTGYLVQVSADGLGDWSDVTTTATGVATYGHTGLTPLTTYFYRVIANGASGQSAVSNVVSGTTSGLPTAPTGLDATAEPLGGVTLTWTDSTDDAGYAVERSTDGTTWTVVGSPVANAVTFFDGTTAFLTQYQYRVRSVNNFGDPSADASNVATATTADSPQALPPTNFAVASNTSFRIELSWTDVDTDESGYLLQRSTDGGSTWTDIPLPADSTGYVDQGRSPNTTYSYRVKATGANGDSEFVALADPVTTPAAPSVEVDNTSVNVTYTGAWATSTAVPGWFGSNYRHDGNSNKGTKTATYTAALPDPAGTYKVGFYYVGKSDRASNVPVDIYTKTGIVTVILNQRINGSQWFEVAGEYEFDSILKVVIRTTGTNGFVMADGVRFRQVS